MFIVARLRLPLVLLGIAAVVFFALSTFLVRETGNAIFDSPDESANFLFTAQFKKASSFLLPAVSGEELPDAARPRSILRSGSFFIPVGFVGFPMLLGFFAKIIGLHYVSYGVLLLSALAAFVWYHLVKAVFGRHAAVLSAVLLLLQPAYMYYTTRLWYPNALFLVFVLLAGFNLVRAFSLEQVNLPEVRGAIGMEIPAASQGTQKKRFYSFLAGAFFGLAIALRPSEANWMIAGLLFALLASRGAMKRLSFRFAALGALAPLFLVGYMQYLVYGGVFSNGYVSVDGADVAGVASRFFLPFGFDAHDAFAVAGTYVLKLFWWLSLPALLGFAAVFLRWGSGAVTFRRRMFLWLMAVLAALLWFGVYYGSWEVRDRIDGGASIGVSYVRYFLPLSVLIVPIMALGLIRTARSLSRFSRSAVAVLVITLVYCSLRAVWWGGDDSLVAVRGTLARNTEVRENILALVPPGAVMITDRGDKIVFPYREVVAEFRSPRAMEQIREIAATREVWYETIADREDLFTEDEKFWKPAGLSLGESVFAGYGHTLYRIRIFKKIL